MCALACNVLVLSEWAHSRIIIACCLDCHKSAYPLPREACCSLKHLFVTTHPKLVRASFWLWRPWKMWLRFRIISDGINPSPLACLLSSHSTTLIDRDPQKTHVAESEDFAAIERRLRTSTSADRQNTYEAHMWEPGIFHPRMDTAHFDLWALALMLHLL